MANIADVMLNKRIEMYATYERALDPDHDWPPPHRRALEEKRDHLKTLCLRGLARCYPGKTEVERAAMLDWMRVR